MPLRLIAVGTRMPSWVDLAYTDYARRLRGSHRLELTEVPLARRSAADSAAQIARLVAEEGRRTLSLLGPQAVVVALDERGTEYSSRELAKKLPLWLREGVVNFLIGGPDGFAPEVLARASERWSLSKMTLPHGLARVLLAEQLYRAVCLNAGHPYHRD
jgi:23S rRNA (pseudouridine1915-N3)-methyltransferase